MRVFDFTHAIARRPGRSVVNGLRDDPTATPDFTAILSEHDSYLAKLRTAGLTVDVLEPLEAFPDSVFVEDPALVFTEGAILLRPGAPTRLGEREPMRAALASRFDLILELDEGEFVDGGDVLVTPETVLIGLSQRTNRAGAAALAAHLSALDRTARIVEPPPGTLHLKTAASLVGEDTVLLTPAMAASGLFRDFAQIVTPEAEDAAANALRINDRVLVGDKFPRTVDRLTDAGLAVVTLSVSEVAKLDAGLSCMSLRWHASASPSGSP